MNPYKKLVTRTEELLLIHKDLKENLYARLDSMQTRPRKYRCFPFLFKPSQIVATFFLCFTKESLDEPLFKYEALRCLEVDMTFNFMFLIVIRRLFITSVVMN